MPESNRNISLDHPTTPGLNPLQTLRLAHELDCDAVVLRMRNFPEYKNNNYDMICDASLRRRVRDEVAAAGMYVAAVNGYKVMPRTQIAPMQNALEMAADLGARGVSVVVYETDKSAHVDCVGDLADRCQRLGLKCMLEFLALSGVNSLGYTVELIQRIGSPALAISADSLHIARTGATAAQVAAVPRGMIAHAQLNDGPAEMPHGMQMEEAHGQRLLPGEGAFDLIGLIRALPPEVTIGVEAGSRERFECGVSMEEHGRAAVAAMRKVIAAALDPVAPMLMG